MASDTGRLGGVYDMSETSVHQPRVVRITVFRCEEVFQRIMRVRKGALQNLDIERRCLTAHRLERHRW